MPLMLWLILNPTNQLGYAEDDSPSQASESSAIASQTSLISSDSSRKSLSDVTQLLLASTTFISCLGTLVALGIQVWSVKVQQSQNVTRSSSVYLSKRGEGLFAFPSNGSTYAPSNTWQLPDVDWEPRIYELWAWRITTVLTLMMSFRRRNFSSMFCAAGAAPLKGLREVMRGMQSLHLLVQRQVKDTKQLFLGHEMRKHLSYHGPPELRRFAIASAKSEAESQKDSQHHPQQRTARVPDSGPRNNRITVFHDIETSLNAWVSLST